ncbi:MAG: TRAP transporter substrate-binding protein DctP, partial [Pseudomonadota bacterium]
RVVLGNNKPITTVDDFKGQKIRGMGYYDSYALVLLGAAGVSIPFTEAFMALQRGVVNGLVTGSVVYDSMGFWEYAKFLCNWPVHGYSAPKFYIANGKAFDALPADLKPIVLKVFREMADETSACNGKLVEASMKKVINGGVKEINPSKEELEKAMKKLAPVREKWIKDCEKAGSPEAKELLEKVEAFLKDYRAKKGK